MTTSKRDTILVVSVLFAFILFMVMTVVFLQRKQTVAIMRYEGAKIQASIELDKYMKQVDSVCVQRTMPVCDSTMGVVAIRLHGWSMHIDSLSASVPHSLR